MTYKAVFQRPKKITGLNIKSYQRFLEAEQRFFPIKHLIIVPVERGLKDASGYSDLCIPDDKIVVPVKLDGLEFKVEVGPSIKRPSYVSFHQRMRDYLTGVMREYLKDKRPRGVLSIGGLPYISLGMVLQEFERLQKEILERGVKRTIKRPNFEEERLEKLLVDPTLNYEGLPVGSGKLYLKALQLYGEVKKDPHKAFLKLLKEEAKYEGIPEKTEIVSGQISSDLGFQLKVIPATTRDYPAVVKSLFNDNGERGPIKSTGVLKAISKGCEEKFIRLDKKFGENWRGCALDMINFRTRGDKRLVSLQGLIDLIDTLTILKTERKIGKIEPVLFPIVSV